MGWAGAYPRLASLWAGRAEGLPQGRLGSQGTAQPGRAGRPRRQRQKETQRIIQRPFRQ